MVPSVDRKTVMDFYDALASRDARRIIGFVADPVDWLLIGPVEFMHFCGQRRSRAEVFELFDRLIPDILDVTGYVQEYLLIDQDGAATLNRLTAIQRSSGRVISYRVANFMRFRNGQVIEFRSVTDTFDAVEQMLGHQVELSEA
jgi:ketosteroid isomerase-like protein